MTDINKLEKLAKLVEAGPWIATPNGPLWIKRDGDGYQRGWRESRANDTAYLNAANPAAILSLISQYRRMKEALRECADDLENEIKARADNELPRRIARDMETVIRARQALQDQSQ